MGRSGDIGWGISTYFGLPNRKKKLLTKEFLQTFKEELIRIDDTNNKKYNRPSYDYENETYMGFFGDVESSYEYYGALKVACEKHNIVKAIYEYAQNLPWYDSDRFDSDLTLEMVNKGVIKYDRPEDYEPLYDVDEIEKAKYKLVEHFKGYDVVEYGSWVDDDRKGLENIYKNSKQELTWLN